MRELKFIYMQTDMHTYLYCTSTVYIYTCTYILTCYILTLLCVEHVWWENSRYSISSDFRASQTVLLLVNKWCLGSLDVT